MLSKPEVFDLVQGHRLMVEVGGGDALNESPHLLSQGPISITELSYHRHVPSDLGDIRVKLGDYLEGSLV